MKKEILAASLSAVMLLQLAACGQKENDEQSTPSVQTVVSDTAETVDTADSSVKDSDINSCTDTEEDEEDSKPLSEPLSMVVSSNAPKSSTVNNNSSKGNTGSDNSSKNNSSTGSTNSSNGGTTTQAVDVPEDNGNGDNQIVDNNPTVTEPTVSYYEPEQPVVEAEPVVPEPEPEPEPEPQEPVYVDNPYAYPNYDLDYIRNEMIEYGISLGMNFDESCDLDNSGWSMVTRSKDFIYFDGSGNDYEELRECCLDNMLLVRDKVIAFGDLPEDCVFNVLLLPDEGYPGEFKVYVPNK